MHRSGTGMSGSIRELISLMTRKENGTFSPAGTPAGSYKNLG